jgi:hypothetical protein
LLSNSPLLFRLSKMPATYFLPRDWQIHPDQVVLGSVIANIKTPDSALSASKLPASIDPPIAPPKQDKPYSGTARKTKEWSAGLFSTFLQVITIGGELSMSSNSTVEVAYSCDLVETRRFTPTLEYIEKAAEDTGVSKHLKMGGLGAKAFMITGVKLAQGAIITTTEEYGKDMTAQLGVELPTVPITLGPKGTHKTSNYRQFTDTVEGPFVFTFEVEKLRVGLRGKVSHKGFVKGAMLARGKGNEEDYVVEMAGEGLDEEEIEDFDVEVRPGIEDESGKACTIVAP